MFCGGAFLGLPSTRLIKSFEAYFSLITYRITLKPIPFSKSPQELQFETKQAYIRPVNKKVFPDLCAAHFRLRARYLGQMKSDFKNLCTIEFVSSRSFFQPTKPHPNRPTNRLDIDDLNFSSLFPIKIRALTNSP